MRGFSRLANHSASAGTAASPLKLRRTQAPLRACDGTLAVVVSKVSANSGRRIDMVFARQLGAMGADQCDQFPRGDFVTAFTQDARTAQIRVD